MADLSKPDASNKAGSDAQKNTNGHLKNDLNEANKINPFINNVLNDLTLSQKLQVVLMSVTIAPIRLVCVSITLAVLWLLGILATTARSKKDCEVPIKGWQKCVYPFARFVSRMVFFFAGFHWLKIRGEPDMNVPIMVLAPHSGFFDSMLITYLNFVCVVGRAGAEKVPLFGNLTKMCQPIIVDRDNQKSRTESVKQLQDRVTSKLGWPPLSIFAEGTCTNRKNLIQFKPGAFIPGQPVQPVCIKYSNTNMDTTTWSWVGPHPYTLCWLSLCQVHCPAEFTFLPVYYPSDEEKSNAQLYAENVRKIMGKALDTPLSDYSFEDGRLSIKVAQHKLPWTIGELQVYPIRKKYKISAEAIIDLVPIFAKMADKFTGKCHLEKFAGGLCVKSNDKIVRLFKIFDKENLGYFTLAQFIEIYFEQIYASITQSGSDQLVQKTLNLLDNFKSNNFYEADELKNELKQKFNIEFEDFNSMQLIDDEKNTISKVMPKQ